jgi:biopolymer transport protein ExbD
MLEKLREYGERGMGFNMTAIIDIVFLLMIFFLVVCKFIEAENFDVTVPDECEYAERSEETGQEGMTTVTVMEGEEGVVYAVGAETVEAGGGEGLTERLALLIDRSVGSGGEGVVTLRVDEGVSFSEARYALGAVSRSGARRVRLAAVRGTRGGGM